MPREKAKDARKKTETEVQEIDRLEPSKKERRERRERREREEREEKKGEKEKKEKKKNIVMEMKDIVFRDLMALRKKQLSHRARGLEHGTQLGLGRTKLELAVKIMYNKLIDTDDRDWKSAIESVLTKEPNSGWTGKLAKENERGEVLKVLGKYQPKK